jgi:hypothetical protein
MKEGRYSVRFALSDSITMYYYNKWIGRQMMKAESYQDVKNEPMPSHHHLTSYQVKPNFVEFTDCVRYALHPPHLEVADAKISCELYENIIFNKLKSPFAEMDSDNNDNTTDLCSWSWLEHDQMFNITLNKTHVWNSRRLNELEKAHRNKPYGMEIALTCNVKGSPEFMPTNQIHRRTPTSPDSKFLSFIIPFLVINEHISTTAAMGSNTSNNLHRIIAIVVGGITTVFATTLVIIFYTIKKRRKR